MIVSVCAGYEYVQSEFREDSPRLEVPPLRVATDAQSSQESGRTDTGGSSHETGGKYFIKHLQNKRYPKLAHTFSRVSVGIKFVTIG